MSYHWLDSYPKGVNWDYTPRGRPVHTFLERISRRVPDRNAFDFLGNKCTYGELQSLVNRVARGLQTRGVTKGTKVGLLLPNTPAYIIFYYAILKTGATIVNFSPLYAEREIEHQIKDSQTEVMVTLDLEMLYPKVKKMLGHTGLKKIVVCPLNEQLPFPKNLLFNIFKRKDLARIKWDEYHIPFQHLLNNNGEVDPVDINPDYDIALIQYTGGTTGVPKGAMLTHKNVYANTLQCHHYTRGEFSGSDKVLAVLPFFHVFAMTAVLNMSIYGGAEIVIQFPRFEPEETLKLIEKHEITLLCGVPTIFNMLAHHKHVKNYDLSSLKYCLSGGASLPLEVKNAFTEITKAYLVEGYGLSETSPVSTLNPFRGKEKERSIGIPLPSTVVKIMSLEDPTQEVPQGDRGEICIKGPQVMKGYWANQQATDESIIDGYFHTGDVGYMDEDGFIYLVDRIKDIILCKGYNVYPRNVEDAIYLNPAVEEVVVAGIPDSVYGQIVKAFVKLKSGSQLSQNELCEFLNDKLSPIEMPREVEFRDELPKTIIGKLSKKELVSEELSKASNGN